MLEKRLISEGILRYSTIFGYFNTILPDIDKIKKPSHQLGLCIHIIKLKL
jgi:hypothetical protein